MVIFCGAPARFAWFRVYWVQLTSRQSVSQPTIRSTDPPTERSPQNTHADGVVVGAVVVVATRESVSAICCAYFFVLSRAVLMLNIFAATKKIELRPQW